MLLLLAIGIDCLPLVPGFLLSVVRFREFEKTLLFCDPFSQKGISPPPFFFLLRSSIGGVGYVAGGGDFSLDSFGA